jgi:nitrate/nitrite transporter NarK
LMPLLSSVLAWPDAFAVFGGLSVLMSAICLMQVSKLSVAAEVDSIEVQCEVGKESEVAANGGSVVRDESENRNFKWSDWPEYFALIWAHSVIGWGFFLFQNWIPTFLQHMYVTNSIKRGLLSALPWIAPAVLSFVFRSCFEMLRNQGITAYKSQTIAHAVACLGAAIALCPLAIAESVTPSVGLACIGVSLALQTCNYSGFHAYVQHFFADKAGAVLGVTNSCGIVVGMVANLAMGWILSATGSYQAMFATTAVLYASSWLMWMVCLHKKRSSSHSDLA